MSEDDGANVDVVDDAAGRRYEAYVDGGLAGYVLYEPAPGRVVLVHTEVDPAFEGRGVGSRLASGVLDDLRSRGLVVTPRCPFIARYIRHHPEYQDLVAPDA